MFERRLLFSLALGLPALGAGCLLDAGAFSNGGGGAGTSTSTGTSTSAGGSGGAGGTTTSTSDTTTSGAGGMTTTTSTGCTNVEDCDDQKPCTVDACMGGMCTNDPATQGTVVPGDPGDCKRDLCDGSGGITQENDDTETPSGQAGACWSGWICQGGIPTKVAANEGIGCPGNAPDCKTYKCKNAECVLTNSLNGAYPYPAYGACAVFYCTDGNQSGAAPFPDSCKPKNGGCQIGSCESMNGQFNCVYTNASLGTVCTKGDGTSGTCDDQGQCG